MFLQEGFFGSGLVATIPRQIRWLSDAIVVCFGIRIVADGNLHSKRDTASVLEYGDRLFGTFKNRHSLFIPQEGLKHKGEGFCNLESNDQLAAFELDFAKLLRVFGVRMRHPKFVQTKGIHVDAIVIGRFLVARRRHRGSATRVSMYHSHGVAVDGDCVLNPIVVKS